METLPGQEPYARDPVNDSEKYRKVDTTNGTEFLSQNRKLDVAQPAIGNSM